MALSITATWLPEVYGYRLDAAGSTGTVTWYRTAYWPDGRYSNVNIGTGVQIFDLSVPLSGATITYQAVDQAGTASATVTPPTIDKPIVSLSSRVDLPAAVVVVETLREQNVNGRAVYYDVIGRNEPYLEPMTPIERTGTMTWRVEHPGGGFPGQALLNLRRLLRTGEALMLRTGCDPYRVEDLSFAVNGWTESQAQEMYGPDRRVSVDWRAVSPLWGTDVMTGRIWGMVPAEFSTWGDVVAGAATWGDLVDG